MSEKIVEKQYYPHGQTKATYPSKHSSISTSKVTHFGTNLDFILSNLSKYINEAFPIMTWIYIFWLIKVLFCISKNDFQHMCFGGNEVTLYKNKCTFPSLP